MQTPFLILRWKLPGIVSFMRRPSITRILISGLSLILIVVGGGMLAYPVATDLYSGRLQRRLVAELASTESRQAYLQRQVREGDGLTHLAIPAIDLSVVVVEGTSPSALRAGAGHYPATPLPGEAGNVAIAGHRTTYGRPFTQLDRLRPGDEIRLATPLAEHTYRVSGDPYVVNRSDWSPIARSDGPTLTLTTCHPKGSAKQRLVVKAELVGTQTRRG